MFFFFSSRSRNTRLQGDGSSGVCSSDSSGRVATATDAANHVTKSGYTPAVGGPLTKTVVTDALGYTETETLDPAWGDPLTITDSNKLLTSLAYDPLGRLTSVWLPGRA